MSNSPDVQNPFAVRLNALITSVRGKMPTPAAARNEAITGLSTAIGGVPDGMAGGVLANVNPMYGLYAAMIGPLVGALFASTQLMRVSSATRRSFCWSCSLASSRSPPDCSSWAG